MAIRRDPRYRGRRRPSAQRPPGHLRTNYVEDDIMAFINDLETLRSVWPESVREADHKAMHRHLNRHVSKVTLIVMIPITALVLYLVISEGGPWWAVPVAQTVALIYLWLRIRSMNSADYLVIIQREAARRGFRYDKDLMPLYHVMNRLNADYNSLLPN